MHFTRNLLFLSLALLGAIFSVNYYAPEKFHSPNAYYALAYFFALTMIVHRMTLRASVQAPQAFIRFFMGSTALRLFVHMLIVIVYRLAFRETATSFLVAFLLLYFIFQVFEVTSLLKHFKKN